jgi:4-hydroxybenzoate polyprenyltransferase
LSRYLRFYRVKDWLHFLPLPLLGWLSGEGSRGALAAGLCGWAFALAYTSAINQAFDDRLDPASKNPRLKREQAIPLALLPLGASLLVMALFARAGLAAAAAMAVAATVYSAPPRLKRIPVVGTVWNVVIALPGFFFAGSALNGWPVLALFAVLLLGSQLLHEAQDREDDAAGGVRTVATEGGGGLALGAASLLVLTLPLLAFEVAPRRGAELATASALFSGAWAPTLWRHRRCADLGTFQRLRLAYRWSAICLGAAIFTAVRF